MSPGRLVFLTGATGFIGARLARALSARGDRLRCYVRDGSNITDLRALRAEVIVGDLLDSAGMAAAMADAALAFHLAAVYDIGVVNVAAMSRVNVSGTRSFLNACRAAQVPHVVYVSTTVALGPVPAGEGDETTVHGARYRSAYERTKTEAHRIALESQREGLPLSIVCPANVYGPGDHGPNGRFIHDILRGRLPGLPTRPSWFSYVHVDDVVAGLIAVSERGGPGSTYVLSGEHMRVDEFARRVAALAGRRPPLLRFPGAMTVATGAILDTVSRVTGIRFPITREAAATGANARWLHSHAKATRELGWQPRTLHEGLPETIADFTRQRAGSA